MAYPPLAISRRSRRRRRMAVAITAAVVLAVFALAVRYRTERREVSDYLAVAKQVADDQAQIARSLEELMGSLSTVERQDLLDRLEAMRLDLSADRQSLELVTIPRPVGVAHGYLTVATDSWEQAIATLDDAMLGILDEPDEPTGEARLATAFELLRVGDRAYEGFLGAVADLDPDLVSEQYPPVAYVGEGLAALYDDATVADRLRLLRRLGERHDIAITVSTDPPPVGEQNDIPVVPHSDAFEVSAVVSNVGNLVETDIPVVLELVTQDGSAAPHSETQTVDSLRPGEATTLTFDGLALQPGNLYELVVRSEMLDDADRENSLFRLVFIRNESA